MNINISPLSSATPNSNPLCQLLGKVLSGEGFIQWIELPADAPVDRQALDMTNQRLRRYLQWMIGGPVLTILHATAHQARDLCGISDSYLAVDTAAPPGSAGQLSLLDNQLQPAWPQTSARPMALAVHGLEPTQIAQRVADARAAQAHATALLLSDTPPQHPGSLWLFDPRENLHNLRSAAQPGSRPHGLVQRLRGAASSTGMPPAPTDFERGLQLCSHLAQAFKEPSCA
ncbi:MAG: hypothetical protein P0Y58_03925 [Candidatus Pseudomonas phytovorans]|uniref:Uncharacterized protein n=1 Tax=Candidatus Pseudomonas phytovorans TaxID=3121377 RepID=A0AAJ6BBZ0_9PSED|nr:hypothetical protein [Pseudomonas sp.]WEK31353.1 MAG: hypothetical protein P0Y58_03925 [Pseudomonas sp.]